ncbi:Pentatricopeptide repeat-containing protein [Tolypocladium ophioglossoides CBS 100239]|uniref:Pentatricopeptide repeat-containing protein n=1 Tax=Tolypocladium ophioglossoides (strain CBS 100239) TaxID=1163406 RepID=A0A0L0N7J7_TOLOC|nr:Pentatricopeptide repeat-containing protein [Tolypocladium ophioglossoides CBS 100239]
MPCRPLLFDLRTRSGPICRSCLYNIQRQAAQPWTAAYSSQASRRARSKPQPRTTDSTARRPSKSELRQYLQGIQELQSAKKDEEEGGFSVRYFEQNDQRRTELPDEQAFGDSLSRLDGSELKEALFDIKDALETQEEKDAFQTVMREMGGGMDTVASADDLEKMMARMQAYTESIDAEIEESGAHLPKEILDELRQDLPELSFLEEGGRQWVSPPQIPEKPWTPNQRKKINRLNVILARVFREVRREPGLTKKSVSSVYKAYHAARMPLAHGWSHVPIDVWDLLWTIFSADESINMHRLSHVSMLARDMSEARVTLSPSQQLLTIEAVFVDGWEPKAIDNWKRCMSTLGDEKSETFQEFWELGVRMYCRVGDMEQAERAVNKLLAKHLNARILLPLIRTLSEQGTPESQERAWTAYRQMRELLGKEIRLSDYDQAVSYFLTTNQTENAQYAFVDMMSDGEIDLKRQKYMPSVVANKFFLGKWLKRLIGAGDLDGAFSVVEFMRRKGVEAAPIHLNGLIGAWQRSGGADDLGKADKMAWDMIESRISFVRARKIAGGKAGAVGKSAAAPWPRATLETFSLLAENYRLRDLHSKLEALWDAFRDAEISPDAFMMNQLLESYIQAGQPKEAMALYQTLVAERGVTPDPYTFSALWKTLGVNRLHVVSPETLEEETDATRRLFAETIEFKSVFQPDGIDGQLARKILHTFRRLKDSAGFLVALTALKNVFRFLPPETLAMELVLGTTKLAWDSAPQRKRLMLAKRDMDRELLARADGDPGKLEGAKRGEALYEFLQKKYWPEDGAYEDKRGALVEVARQMGVYELLAPRTTGKGKC